MTAGEWTAGPVTVAAGFRRRWRGLRPRAGGRALILAGRSAHTVGMHHALWFIGVTSTGEVATVRYALPGRVISVGSAHFVLELPPTHPPPPRHARLVIETG